MGTEAQRAKVYGAVAEHWGEEVAVAIMELLPPHDMDDFARKSDIALLRGEFGELRGELGELKGQFSALSGKVDAQFSKIMVANVTMMFGFSGLAAAAAGFL